MPQRIAAATGANDTPPPRASPAPDRARPSTMPQHRRSSSPSAQREVPGSRSERRQARSLEGRRDPTPVDRRKPIPSPPTVVHEKSSGRYRDAGRREWQQEFRRPWPAGSAVGRGTSMVGARIGAPARARCQTGPDDQRNGQNGGNQPTELAQNSRFNPDIPLGPMDRPLSVCGRQRRGSVLIAATRQGVQCCAG